MNEDTFERCVIITTQNACRDIAIGSKTHLTQIVEEIFCDLAYIVSEQNLRFQAAEAWEEDESYPSDFFFIFESELEEQNTEYLFRTLDLDSMTRLIKRCSHACPDDQTLARVVKATHATMLDRIHWVPVS